MITLSDIRRAVSSRNTGYRVPETTPTLGFSMDCEEDINSISFEKAGLNVHSTELKLAVNYTLDPYSNEREKGYRTDQMVKQLHNHIYGEVQHRLQKVIRDLTYQLDSDSLVINDLKRLSKDLESQ